MSSGIFYLSSQHFRVVETERGKELCNSLNGISVVLFYSEECSHCTTLIPIFNMLPNKIHGVLFGMNNIKANNKQVYQMSQQTIAPLRYVPYIMMYYNGVPQVEYPNEDPRTLEAISSFIMRQGKNILERKPFASNGAMCSTKGRGAYCGGSDPGVDVCAISACYTCDELYDGKPGKPVSCLYTCDSLYK